MNPDSLQLLFSREQIEQRTRELAAQISADYHGLHLVIVGVLKGCFVFLADIIRSLDLDITIDFVQAASYGAGRESSGVSTLEKDLGTDIRGRDILIVEDIVDTGETLSHLIGFLQQRSPASLRVCALLNKQSRRRVPVTVDYCGFEVDDVFVVGFGLDFDERYHSLPGIYALPPEVPA
jgi:hypoxanthine phosphoribosyltransferase